MTLSEHNPNANLDESNPIPVKLISPLSGEAIIESNGAIPVNIQDQTSDIVDLYLTRFIDNITLTAATNIDDLTITFDSATAPVNGNIVCLKEELAFYQGKILSFVNNGGGNYTATLDTPLDYAYTTAGGCSINEHDLATANGSVTPVYFRVSPENLATGVRWDIVRLIIYIEGTLSMDSSKFGDQVALTKGLVIRKKDTTYKNIFNVKTNGELEQRAYDLRYNAKAPAGASSLLCRRTFGGQEKNGVVIRLNADDNDQFEAIVQDNLTTLTHVHVIVQGHVVAD